jgi:MFS family permease
MGIYAMMAGAGGAIGLLAGGLITTYLTWRWVLFVNVPIGLLVAFVAPRVLAMGRIQPGRFDLPGALTGTVGLTTLVYGFNHAATYGWSNSVTLAALAAAAALLATFIVIETRTQQPLMPLRIFSQRNRSGGYGLALTMGVAMFGMFFFLTLFVQTILHYSPVRAGLAFLPFTAVIITAATVVSRTVGRIGTRLPMTVGPLVLSAALFWLSRMSEQTTYVWGILGPILLLGAGAGLIFVPLSLSVMAGTNPRELGLASALLNVGQQVGGSIGLALLGTIAATVTRHQLQTVRPTPVAVSHAMVSGFGSALEVSTAIMLVGFVIALLVVRGRPPAVAANTMPDAA